MKVTFHGVRGSCPCPDEDKQRYGGNTSCVVIEADGEPPLILDLGTGLRSFAAGQPTDGSFRANVLLSHVHWDHVQGLPFFAPVDRPGARLDVFGPPQEGDTLAEVFDGLMRPPYFPVRFSELRGDISFHDLTSDELTLGSFKVTSRPVPHCGTTVGFRVECGGGSVAYVSDHQAPVGPGPVSRGVLELCDGVDLLVHDAQYTPEEFAEKPHWGHGTAEYAVRVAKEAGVRRLALFHHDPSHDDHRLDELVERARCLASITDVDEVMAAAEGLVVDLPRH